MSIPDLARVVAIVPVRSISGAKTRLGEPLDPEERAELILALARQTIRAALASPALMGTLVVSRDPELLSVARSMGADTLLQRTEGLNEALADALADRALDAGAVLVLPGDLPAISVEAIDALVEAARKAAGTAPGRPVVVAVPDRHGTGTNALLIGPPGAIEFRFGEGSRAAHAAEAARAGAAYVEVDGPLAFDLDTPEDLLEADVTGLDREAGR